MGVGRYLRHWLSGTGTCLQVIDFLPQSDPIRQWADTFPWETLVDAIETSFANRFPKSPSAVGTRCRSVSCVLWSYSSTSWAPQSSLQGRKGDEDLGHRWRTDFAVMHACGLREYQINSAHSHFVLPETLCEFRRRLDEPLIDERLAIQAARAMGEGLVSPAHLVIDPFPGEPGSQRVTDTTTLYKAQKKP